MRTADFSYLTKNPKDFEDISDLKLVFFKQEGKQMNTEMYLEELIKDCMADAKQEPAEEKAIGWETLIAI